MAMGIRELAAATGVSTNTITRFERGEQLKLATVQRLRAALEDAGIEFIPENGGGPGLRINKKI